MAPTTATHASVLRQLLYAAATGDRDSIADLVTEDVIGWSPSLSISSRDELLAALEDRDDTLSEVAVEISALDHVGDKAIAEWHLAADHTGPLVIDDLVIAPSGRRLTLSGATVAEFDGDRICAFRNYFDDLALVEQALVGE